MGAVTSSNITKRPHLHISTIGLPWLSYAFGISVGAPLGSSWRGLVSFTYQIKRRHSHDNLNMPALNKANFPNLKLQRIRVLSQSTPNTLNKSDKTSGENGGYDRWNRWSTTCLRSGIRLEDCSWQSLGTLPQGASSERRVRRWRWIWRWEIWRLRRWRWRRWGMGIWIWWRARRVSPLAASEGGCRTM